MDTLSKYYGSQVVEIIAAQRRLPSGALGQLEPDATLFPFVVRKSGDTVYYDLVPGHAVRRLTPAEISSVDYTGNKASATFFELTLPGGSAPDAFAMRDSVQLNIFQGVTQADMEIVAKPHVIKRILDGDEVLVSL